MDSLWAEEVLRDRGADLNAPSLRALTLLATDDERAADRVYARRLLDELRRGVEPAV